MKKDIGLIARGFCMGMADIVPGVSGGTMAYILGIYERLIAAINSFKPELLLRAVKGEWKLLLTEPHWRFVAALGAGIFCAILFFTKVVSLPTLLAEQPVNVYALFFGLVAGSVVVLMSEEKPFKSLDFLHVALGAIAAWFIVTALPVQAPDATWFVFLSGAIAITAMLVPGISGAFLLLVLGQYTRVLEAVATFDVSILAPLVLGMVCGIIAFARLLGWLLSSYKRIMMMVINGILIGSLWRLWPWQVEVDLLSSPYLPAGENMLMPIILMSVGGLSVWALHRIAK